MFSPTNVFHYAVCTYVACYTYHSSTFFVAKIIHVYIFRSILFLLFSISLKIFEHKIFFSEVNKEVYSEVYHLLDQYFSRLSSLLLSGRPVQTKCQNFKGKWVKYQVEYLAVILPFFEPFFQDYPGCIALLDSRYAVC